MRYWTRTPKILSPDQIVEAKQLREEGYSRRQLAELFRVGETTIWENVYRVGKARKRIRNRQRRESVITYRKIQIAMDAVRVLRDQGFNSLQVSIRLNIPIKEVNFIYSHLN